MHSHIKLAGAIFAVVAMSTLSARAQDATGLWSTENARAQVRIAPCGSAICGTIIALKEPNDPATGKPKTDKNNPDAGKQSRPMIGVQTLSAMKPNGGAKWSGQIYNAEDGKTYSGHVTLENSTRIKVEGCVMGGMICKAQYWTRLK